ncbi:Rieske 2Fe-2S domain-containing protein [Fibrella sp. HMF5335]|uniref:Rieske 2Fe-2S domain-containing protein n=1 Tax=Fibrella rubiginis TaxID=2817060 RepID=A0A939K326_9BACT|nr:Rieske 2Fe-2S domain-containing protein [Fibrella rubiginis]MBO0938797.1 Rieske 2Fe-2S domain-containing protein [Fibrella rubiginis]
MNRYTFLKAMGFRGAALMAVMASCVKPEDTYVDALTLAKDGTTSGGPTSTTTVVTTPPASSTGTTADILGIKNPLLTIDLTATASAALRSVGGYLVKNSIVVAQVSAGVYAAVTQTCSHEPKKQVTFNVNEFYCTAHGARFNLNGTGKNSLGSRGIAAYKTISDGKTLVVY